jgi:K+-transporting ATPase ATPase C chain
MQSLIASIRIAVVTMLICVLGYSVVVWSVGQVFTPDSAAGSLVRAADGTVIGSRLIAQKFEQPRNFWPRPSAAGKEGFDATSAGGSNKSPTSEDLAIRAKELIARYSTVPERPLPAELVAASGSGLDPHISIRAALYQAERVAKARGLSLQRVEELIGRQVLSPGAWLTPDRLVNVLELNVAIDELTPAQ